MNTSPLIEQLKAVSKDLWGAIQSGEPINDSDRIQLENAIVLLQLSSIESKYPSHENTGSGHFDGGRSDQGYPSAA